MTIDSYLKDAHTVSLDDVKIPLDSNQIFAKLLISQMTSLQSALLEEHDKEVSALRAENQALRARLCEISHATPLPLLDIVSPDGARELAQTETEFKTVTSLDEIEVPVSSPDHSVFDAVHCSEDRLLASQPEANEEASQVTEDERRTAPRRPTLLKKHPSMDLSKVEKIKPTNMPLIKRIVFSHAFEVASGLVILANTLMMALRLQYDGIDIGFEIGAGGFSKSAAHTWPNAEAAFQVIDILFNAVFIIELLVRVAAMRVSALHSGWVWFDTIIIAVSVIDTFGSGLLPVNPSMLRLLRLARLVRLLKILKAMSAVDSLFLLLKAIHASTSAAMWSFSILIVVQVVTGLFLNQMAQTFLHGDGATTAEAKVEVFIYYGTFSRTMLTMFEITMASWSKPCRVLVENVHESFMLFFMFYRCLFCFALLKVISAVFITETNRVLQHDDELTLLKLHRERERFDKKMRKLTKHFKGNVLDWAQLQEFAYDIENRRQLSTLGVKPQDLEKLFWICDDGSKTVPLDDFLRHMGIMKGDVKAIDVHALLKVTRKIDMQMSQVFAQQGLIKMDADEEAMETEICGV